MAYHNKFIFSRKNMIVTALGLGVLTYMSVPDVNILSVYAADKMPENTAMPAMPVGVVTLKTQKIRLHSEFSGRFMAVEQVDVRPLVSGTISNIHFTEGGIVRRGDALFTIDVRPFAAALEQSKAQLNLAQSNVTLAKQDLNRSRDLVDKNIISKSRYDALNNALQVALAQVNIAKAQVKSAQLNYDFAHIKAPISGRIGRAEMTVGNIVASGSNAPILTRIVSNDKIYVEFDIDEQTYLRTAQMGDLKNMTVTVSLSENSEKTYQGKIKSFDNQINPESGTIRVRAILDNDGLLMSGMFARIKLFDAAETDIIAVPVESVMTDQDRKFLYVISPDNKVTYRPVTLGKMLGGYQIIDIGVSDGEKVMVDNLQKVRPDMVVIPKETPKKAKN